MRPPPAGRSATFQSPPFMRVYMRPSAATISFIIEPIATTALVRLAGSITRVIVPAMPFGELICTRNDCTLLMAETSLSASGEGAVAAAAGAGCGVVCAPAGASPKANAHKDASTKRDMRTPFQMEEAAKSSVMRLGRSCGRAFVYCAKPRAFRRRHKRTMSSLFSPLRLRDVTLRNRVAVSPMCEYSSADGFANDWHVVHLGSRAVGGASLVFTEAIAVTPEGRISPQDLGIWKDEHVAELARIGRFCDQQGARWGTQLAHAGRKGSTKRPWEGGGAVEADGWTPVGPGTEPFDPRYPVPHALDETGIAAIVAAFAAGARRTLEAGGSVLEIHGAHGYLVHEFLSPLVNRRTDRWGGSLEKR